ncbi:MAG: ferredoxin [Acidobacteria bacterium]|nr:MAG: ferredoxin [Acidobacteriota bacterium]PYS84779.1 MAG: ferredoxin [Acidobacteriota bacterium]
MSEEARKNPLNVQGRYYVTDDCLACAVCEHEAPNNFRIGEDGMSHVFKQPETPEEERQCLEALRCCCVEAIRGDG